MRSTCRRTVACGRCRNGSVASRGRRCVACRQSGRAVSSRRCVSRRRWARRGHDGGIAWHWRLDVGRLVARPGSKARYCSQTQCAELRSLTNTCLLQLWSSSGADTLEAVSNHDRMLFPEYMSLSIGGCYVLTPEMGRSCRLAEQLRRGPQGRQG